MESSLHFFIYVPGVCLKLCPVPQSPEQEENKERAFTESKKHKVNALITFPLG